MDPRNNEASPMTTEATDVPGTVESAKVMLTFMDEVSTNSVSSSSDTSIANKITSIAKGDEIMSSKVDQPIPGVIYLHKNGGSIHNEEHIKVDILTTTTTNTTNQQETTNSVGNNQEPVSNGHLTPVVSAAAILTCDNTRKKRNDDTTADDKNNSQDTNDDNINELHKNNINDSNESTKKQQQLNSSSQLSQEEISQTKETNNKTNGETKPRSGLPKKQLEKLAKVKGFEITYKDFPQKDQFSSLVSLSTKPNHVSYGVGSTVEESHNAAAKLALKALEDAGVDCNKSQQQNSNSKSKKNNNGQKGGNKKAKQHQKNDNTKASTTTSSSNKEVVSK